MPKKRKSSSSSSSSKNNSTKRKMRKQQVALFYYSVFFFVVSSIIIYLGCHSDVVAGFLLHDHRKLSSTQNNTNSSNTTTSYPSRQYRYCYQDFSTCPINRPLISKRYCQDRKVGGKCRLDECCYVEKSGNYIRKHSGRCTYDITTIRECDIAAKALNFSDTIATDDRQNYVTYDPSGCYFENNMLKFNARLTNTGPCTVYDNCLCKIQDDDKKKKTTNNIDNTSSKSNFSTYDDEKGKMDAPVTSNNNGDPSLIDPILFFYLGWLLFIIAFVIIMVLCISKRYKCVKIQVQQQHTQNGGIVMASMQQHMQQRNSRILYDEAGNAVTIIETQPSMHQMMQTATLSPETIQISDAKPQEKNNIIQNSTMTIA